MHRFERSLIVAGDGLLDREYLEIGTDEDRFVQLVPRDASDRGAAMAFDADEPVAMEHPHGFANGDLTGPEALSERSERQPLARRRTLRT